ncbi:hypothetical protein D3C72_1725470 [compost metagenome]
MPVNAGSYIWREFIVQILKLRISLVCRIQLADIQVKNIGCSLDTKRKFEIRRCLNCIGKICRNIIFICWPYFIINQRSTNSQITIVNWGIDRKTACLRRAIESNPLCTV